MTDGPTDESPLAAGPFSLWLGDMQTALRGERDADVPCAGCTACCTSSQFVHIGPDETDTLAHIPAELLFPAPRMPADHVLLGYDTRGHCPMLVDGRCSIYEHRPRTCRTYDCRVFAATGVEVEGETKEAVASRVRRWQFSYPSDADRDAHEAVKAAAVRLRSDTAGQALTATQLAVLAVERYELGRSVTGQ